MNSAKYECSNCQCDFNETKVLKKYVWWGKKMGIRVTCPKCQTELGVKLTWRFGLMLVLLSFLFRDFVYVSDLNEVTCYLISLVITVIVAVVVNYTCLKWSVKWRFLEFVE